MKEKFSYIVLQRGAVWNQTQDGVQIYIDHTLTGRVYVPKLNAGIVHWKALQHTESRVKGTICTMYTIICYILHLFWKNDLSLKNAYGKKVKKHIYTQSIGDEKNNATGRSTFYPQSTR